MDYDVVIIGAGMSGLAAGIRLAMFDQRVCIVERHNVYGGLNSFYTLDGRRFDVGLHALTNFVKPGVRNTALPKLLRQLRISRDRFDLCEQNYSAITFPGRRLRFNNDPELLINEVQREFPAQVDSFLRLVEDVRCYNDLDYTLPWSSSRRRLGEYFCDRTLIDMLLCPVMFYGSAEQDDMDFTQFVTIFRSIVLEGLARPRQGVRRIIAELVKRYRECGGEFRMGCGARSLECDDGRVTSVVLDSSQTITADVIMSSVGYPETMALCEKSAGAVVGRAHPTVGRMTFVESISVLDCKPAELGLDATIIFFNDAQTFRYATPDEPIDPRSGVICCPNNYERHEDMDEGYVRLTSLANYDRWTGLAEAEYLRRKDVCYGLAADHATKFIPEFRHRTVYRDIFTPRTIRHYTGHYNGAVYGSPHKVRDGRTPYENLFICGTDQGFLGIIGALMSGISMANMHVLAK